MNTKLNYALRVIGLLSFLSILSADLLAQRPGQAPPAEESMFTSIWFYLGLVAIAGLVGLAVHMRRKQAADAAAEAAPARSGGEMKMTYKKTPAAEEASARRVEKVSKVDFVIERKLATAKAAAVKGIDSLPISSFIQLQKANAFIQLPESSDPALLDAIERSNEEAEEDAGARTQALKMLATSKTANSIGAIAQMALYDLSSKLRSDAVLILAEMDHESVFEAIVTACADPTREVRAAAARAFVKVSFDRASAWVRIIESGDMPRMKHAVRCAVEGDLVNRSFDRLVHADRKIAYEAFALTALLIKSGETEAIYHALETHRDDNVKLAILHVLQTIKDDRTPDELSSLMNKCAFSDNVSAKINEVRACLQMAAV